MNINVIFTRKFWLAVLVITLLFLLFGFIFGQVWAVPALQERAFIIK